MKKLEEYKENSLKKRIPTLSLFTGAGGLDIGFHNAGFDIVGCVEIEEAYCKTLEKNREKGNYFSTSAKIHCMDIREFNAEDYKDAGIECIIGGPPCQTFSAAGRRSGGVLGTKDQRGKLFESYCRILSILKPKIFVFENVYGLPGANGGEPWKEIVSAFSQLGYHLQADVLDAADYGVPQHRERLIIVGTLGRKFCFTEPTHGPDSKTGLPLVSVWDAIGNLQDNSEPEHEFDGMYGHLLSLVPEGLNYSFFTREMGYPKPYFAWRSKFHDFLYKADRNAPCRTIKAQPGKFTGPLHWKNRHFTVNELKRLQSFPDNYEIIGSNTKIIEQIGNSVPPRLAEVIAISVKEQLIYELKSLTFQPRQQSFKSSFRQRQREQTKHYKDIAHLEIIKRFPNVSLMVPNKEKITQEVVISYSGFFKKEIHSESSLISDVGTMTFSVQSVQDGETLALVISRPGISPKKKMNTVNINIVGLGKYLIAIDRVSVIADIIMLDDIFKIWDIIQERLTSTSQFFTLIDIYGHYANRGDTVYIKTNIEYNKRDLIAKGINFFGQSSNCGIFMDRNTLASALNIKITEIGQIVRLLRELRFDVRTSETHSTISTNEIICTYPFPLLSEEAQLERQLKA